MIGRGLLVAAVGAALLGAGPVAAQSRPGDDPCARFSDAPVVDGTVEEPDLVELSGLDASGVHDGVLWAHNDSGDQPRVFALDENGAALGTYALEGAANVDWEDLAVGPGPDGGSAVFVADIGQNGGLRDPVTVYWAPEPVAAPDGTGGTLLDVEVLELSYPSVDAEALLVDPVTGDLLIVTKVDGTATILRAPADALVPGAPIAMEEVGTITVPSLVTGGDVAADGSLVVLRTYGAVLAFARAEGQTVAEALRGEACTITVADEPQGEAVAVSAAGDGIITISEVGPVPGGDPLPVHRIAVEPLPEPAPETTTTAAAADDPAAVTDEQPAPDDDGDGGGPAPIVVGSAVVAVLALAGLAVVVARGRRGRRRR